MLFINPLTIEAQCGYTEKVRLQKIAGNVSFSYEHNDSNININKEGIEFTITISNIHPDIYVKDTLHGDTYTFENNSSIATKTEYLSGINIIYKIYGNTENCKGELLMSSYVNIPSYNIYHHDPMCKGIETYELCQKWSKVNLNYNQFTKRIEQYRESLMEKPEIDDEGEKSLIDNLIYFFTSKYYFIIMISIIVVSSLLMYYLNKKNNFDLK
ncbi:MAG: hypothetical protein PHO63_00465 [Bacilli bacterium]|nr:hypothetical protein [Bacilli bacterium]